ncbi:hypothetical protein ACFX2G_047823 [Malus domestica]
MNESLMRLLLKLDSDPVVREAKRKGGKDGGFGRNWDDVLAEMKDEACRDKGGEEMERFCAQYMGFF